MEFVLIMLTWSTYLRIPSASGDLITSPGLRIMISCRLSEAGSNSYAPICGLSIEWSSANKWPGRTCSLFTASNLVVRELETIQVSNRHWHRPMHVLRRPSSSSPSSNDVVAVSCCDLRTMTFGSSSDNPISPASLELGPKCFRCIAKSVVEVLGSVAVASWD